jgi:hypothetical protein
MQGEPTKLPLPPEEFDAYGNPCSGGNTICPECGDEAFFVDQAETGKPDDFAFSCDSCNYIIDYAEAPEALMGLARKVGMRP